jgi:glycosyltransferase involved in cell wall biosynthesis
VRHSPSEPASSSPAPRVEAPPAPPLVSIVVPVYNGAGYLAESLDSLLRQTYPNVEIVVFDDASTDRTPEILVSYGSRIRVVRQKANRGIYGNANDGIAAARGELIAIYHADDVYEPTIVEREADFLGRHPDAGAVFCLDVFIDAQGREYDRLRLPPEIRGRGVLPYETVLNGILRYRNRFLVCPSAMVRAAVYREVGPYRDEEFGIGSDLEMWLRIARHHPLGMLEEFLIRYRHFHGNASQKHHHLRTTEEETFRIVDLELAGGGRSVARPDAVAAHEGHRAEDRLRIAVAHYINGEPAKARAALAAIRARAILSGANIQKGRLLVVLAAFRLLSRLPRSRLVSDLFYRRWFVKRPPRPRTI